MGGEEEKGRCIDSIMVMVEENGKGMNPTFSQHLYS